MILIVVALILVGCFPSREIVWSATIAPRLTTTTITNATAAATATATATATAKPAILPSITPAVTPTASPTPAPTIIAKASVEPTMPKKILALAYASPTTLPPSSTPIAATATTVPTATPTEIPDRIHIVARGETLSEIAKSYDISMQTLLETNEIQNADRVYANSELRIPSSKLATPAPQPTAMPTLLTLEGVTANLYFVADGDLLRWHADSGQLNKLLDGVVSQYRVSEDEQTILALQLSAETEPPSYNLIALNSLTNKLTVIAENSSELIDIALSADSQHAIYIQPNNQPNNKTDATVFAVDISQPDQKIELGDCISAEINNLNRPCESLFSSNTAQSILYGDSRGIWQTTFNQQDPQLILSYEQNQIANHISPIAWSPNQRYLLLWGYFAEGATRFVFDSETNRLANVPYSDAFVFEPDVSWLPNNDLFIIEPSDPFNGRRPAVTTLAIDLASATMFSEISRVSITTVEEYDPDPSAFSGFQAFAPAIITQSNPSFVLLSADTREQGLYTINLDSLQVVQSSLWAENTAQYQASEITWLPDQSALIATYSNEQGGHSTFLVSGITEQATELPLQEYDSVCCFQWSGQK